MKDEKNYIGYTSDIERRMLEHAKGMVKLTRNRRPLKLIHTESFETAQEARKREKFFKSGQGRQMIKKIISN